jgi:bifunctional DNA-binding transcriptional regulator/antitoxin component of YhaV-PrlF toxin-antitoxin module
MPAKPYVAIPAALRRRCRLEPGDRILLAVLPGEDMLAAYSFASWTRRCGRMPRCRVARGGAQLNRPFGWQ